MFNNQKELIKELTDRELLLNLYVTQAILLSIAFVIGVWKYDSYASFAGLWHWNSSDIWIIGGISGILVVALDLALMKMLPQKWYDDGGINERIFRHRSLLHLFFLCLMIAFTEEILFRGVLQVHFGLFWASVIFALVHVRYLSKVFLLVSVVVLSFFLGVLFSWTDNLAVTVTAHFLIDFLLALHINKGSKRRTKRAEKFEER
ncbi:CPBP family intramembrane glutamic endopeptidase [Priestia abyssalis]|uniref:CPBP family intramembrane glutamic endopeptidase n=1 Tax=Priestia abyssalis TaxID=1221450 RepID=UPI0009951571|nr:CPBP family intramembrane glutamic endopeptidase [Priestia abyssalis]